jgi:glycine/D-amino acid oxidase-like deaminating enzyme
VSERVEYLVIGLGSWGSSAAYHLARSGHSVVGLEQFEFGHDRGASHDTSRILRHSYHTPGYVRLTFDAYNDWATLEADSGESLVTTVGGLDIYPADEHGSTFDGSDTALDHYTSSMRTCGVEFEELTAAQAMARWPMYNLDEGTRVVYQERGSIVPAGRGTATM